MNFKQVPSFDGEQKQQAMEDEKLFEKLADEYMRAVVSADKLETIPIQVRARIVGDWMKEGDLGFIYGFRGSGKGGLEVNNGVLTVRRSAQTFRKLEARTSSRNQSAKRLAGPF